MDENLTEQNLSIEKSIFFSGALARELNNKQIETAGVRFPRIVRQMKMSGKLVLHEG